MVDEQLSELGKAVADGEESKVSDFIFSQNQSLYSTEVFETGYVFIIDFTVRKVDFFSMRCNNAIFESDGGGSSLGIWALHEEFELVELCLGVTINTFSSLFLFLRVSFCILIFSEVMLS